MKPTFFGFGFRLGAFPTGLVFATYDFFQSRSIQTDFREKHISQGCDVKPIAIPWKAKTFVLDFNRWAFGAAQGSAIQVRVGLLPGGGGQVADYQAPSGRLAMAFVAWFFGYPFWI